MHCLSIHERDFNVCSDCIFFHKTNVIDERYPEIVEGYCDKFEGIFDNRWETKCKECTADKSCEQCIFCDNAYFDDDENKYISFCKKLKDNIEEFDGICMYFED